MKEPGIKHRGFPVLTTNYVDLCHDAKWWRCIIKHNLTHSTNYYLTTPAPLQQRSEARERWDYKDEPREGNQSLCHTAFQEILSRLWLRHGGRSGDGRRKYSRQKGQHVWGSGRRRSMAISGSLWTMVRVRRQERLRKNRDPEDNGPVSLGRASALLWEQ